MKHVHRRRPFLVLVLFALAALPDESPAREVTVIGNARCTGMSRVQGVVFEIQVGDATTRGDRATGYYALEVHVPDDTRSLAVFVKDGCGSAVDYTEVDIDRAGEQWVARVPTILGASLQCAGVKRRCGLRAMIHQRLARRVATRQQQEKAAMAEERERALAMQRELGHQPMADSAPMAEPAPAPPAPPPPPIEPARSVWVRLSGRVIDGRDEPVHGALVLIGSHRFDRTTDRDGIYRGVVDLAGAARTVRLSIHTADGREGHHTVRLDGDPIKLPPLKIQ